CTRTDGSRGVIQSRPSFLGLRSSGRDGRLSAYALKRFELFRLPKHSGGAKRPSDTTLSSISR
ncbi:MAG: hypothetical protein ACXVIB_05485, partial [Halobacteriota archaeon]